jgi:hypothetical protein
MSKVLCKFQVTEIIEMVNHYRGQTPVSSDYGKGGHAGGETAKKIKLAAVMGEPFGPATPQGSVEMLIVNPAAAEHFHVGKEYYVTFKEDDGTGSE